MPSVAISIMGQFEYISTTTKVVGSFKVENVSTYTRGGVAIEMN